MGYAKKLSKQYNASSAWSFLGTDRSAYEKESLPVYENIFNYISGRVSKGPQNRAESVDGIQEYIDGMTNSAKRSIQNRGAAFDINNIEGFLSTIQQLPKTALNAALAGRYINIF